MLKNLNHGGEKGVSNWIFNIDPVNHTRSPQDETDNNYEEFYDNWSNVLSLNLI